MICTASESRHHRQAGGRRGGRSPEKGDPSAAGLLARLILLGMVTATPWLLGGVYPACQVWLFGLAIAGLLCWLARQFTRRRAVSVLPLAMVPLLCALGLGAVQLILLPGGTSALLSPRGADLRGVLASEDSPGDTQLIEGLGIEPLAAPQQLSLYPASTRRDLALLVLAAAMFFLGAVFFSSPRAQLWLCGAVAVNGAALSLFGLLQKFTWNGFMYWSVPMLEPGGAFGPFVNRNNAGGYLNLCLAGALGLTVYVIERRRVGNFLPMDAPTMYKSDFGTRLWERLIETVANLDGATLFAVGMTGCIVAGILCSLSRGAGLAMVGATLLLTLLLLCVRRRRAQVWFLAVVAMVGLCLLSWGGMSESVYARLATLMDTQAVAKHELLPHWRTALRAVPEFWPVGSGLGTYRYVYGMYQEEAVEAWFYHAENQYVEAIVEGGLPGIALLLTGLGLIGAAAWRMLRDEADARVFAFGVAGIFALTSQLIAGAADFGLHIPANLILFALVCGAVSGGAAQLAHRKRSSSPVALNRRSVVLGVGVLLLAAAIWGAWEIRRVAAVETSLCGARFAETPGGTSEADLLDRMDQLAAAVEGRPDDAAAQCGMARLWIHLYRVRALGQLRSAAAAELGDEALWEATAPLFLHGRAHELARDNLRADLEALRNEPIVSAHLGEALKHLVLARRACPLMAEVHLGLAELAVLVADPADDQIHIERAEQLLPGDADLMARCGLLEFQAGRLDRAYASWRKSLRLAPDHLDEVLAMVGEQLEQPAVAAKLLPDAPELLIKLARERYAGPEDAAVRRRLLERAEEILDQADLSEDERCHSRGEVLVLREAYGPAIENYTRAVELRPRETAWRHELALLLEQQGLLDAAYEQARACARLAPRQAEYRKLLEQIHDKRLRQSGDTR